MQAVLRRVTLPGQSSKGTFGVLHINGLPFCVTCEDPDNGNKVGVSCVPIGTYKCMKRSSARFPDTWELLNVPGRTAILIHAGNTIDDTHGCILVGRCFGMLGMLPAVLQSKEALDMMRAKIPAEFDITITN